MQQGTGTEPGAHRGMGSTARTPRGCSPGSRSTWPCKAVLCPGTPGGQIALTGSPEHGVEGAVLPRLAFAPTLPCPLVLTGTEVEFFFHQHKVWKTVFWGI